MNKTEEINAPFIGHDKFSSRITRTEVNIYHIQDDVKEIKRTLRWIIGLIFSLNSTIIGLLAKDLNLF